MTTSSMGDEPGATESESSHSEQGSSDDAIRVCVRFRPLTPNEVAKHESEVWGKVDDATVGVVGRFGITAKYAYDKVYGPDSGNGEIYHNMVSDLVDSVPDGICNTVFAYGVTSSGKTHTMHGTEDQPGVVSRSLRQLFECAYGDKTRDYMLRLSYVEIYNEVINDLLDPARINLRVVEDPVRGQVVEGARECPILTAEEALELVAQGEAHRKVSATAANEGSSRSHTIVRVSVESTSTATATSGPTRRLSALNLIDLAGSEAAKVQQSREQSREGSYINRSLLALGTVIAKLGDRNASHIPFRDSKLTRLLASSLSGRGARVCIVCTATPTAAQAEETHNTLKFAMRAKAVRVSATRNERSNTYELLMRYQQEVADLRQQLWHMQQQQGHGGHGQPSPFAKMGMGAQQPCAPQPGPVATAAAQDGGEGGRDLASLQEVLALREQLEEERAVRVMYEREREELKNRVARLTRLAMSSDYNVPPPEHLSQEAQLASEAVAQEDRGVEDVEVEVWRAEQSLGLTQNGIALDDDAGASQEATVDMSEYHNVIMGMREQMLTLQDELMERDRQISDLRTQGESILANASMIRIEAERDLDASGAEISELQASASVGEHEGTETWQDQQVLTLQDEYKALEQQLHASKEENEKLRRARAHDSETLRRLQSMEGQVQVVVQELNAKEKQLQAERKTLLQFQALEQQVEMQLNETSQENSKLRLELQRLETNNNRLQGYQLDSMSGTELSHLVRSLTQAVERVRVTVQMRRLATPSPPDGSPRAAAAHAAANEPQWPAGSRSPEAGGRVAPHRPPPPPPLVLTGINEPSLPSAASNLSLEQRDASRNVGSQQLNDLHKAMPSLRRPKPYNYSRTPEGGTPRTPNTTSSSSGPSSSRSGNFLM